MSKKIKILTLPSVDNIDQSLNGLSKKADLVKGQFDRIEFVFKEGIPYLMHRSVDLKDYSFVWLSSFWRSRDLAYAINLYLDHFDTPHTFVEKSTSKITDQLQMALYGILTPDTFFVDSRNIRRFLPLIKKVCGFPLIIKDTRGFRGRFSAYVKNEAEFLDNFMQLPAHKKYFFQKFIPNDYDWGVLVANGEVVSAEKSYAQKGEFRNNACNGAKEVFVPVNQIPDLVRQMALKANNLLGLSWSRSDIIVDRNTGIPYLLEVNRCPGVTSGTSEVDGCQKFLRSQLAPLVQ